MGGNSNASKRSGASGIGNGLGSSGGRTAANSVDVAIEDTHESILRNIYEAYNNPASGLVNIGAVNDLTLLSPRRKISVVLIGNHSSGKSSFINWYVEEKGLLKTSVAIETQGFTLVTSGKKRETLTGDATLQLFPYFKPFAAIPEIPKYLTTEISTQKAKQFKYVTFIDTPGLVDGDMQNPFDIDQAVLWLCRHADLILVFFDPIGQALCARTMNVVQRANEVAGDKLHFYLTKADTVEIERDRQKVIIQITQNLTQRVKNRQFELPTIYIPSDANRECRVENQIQGVAQLIEQTIQRTIQNTLNSFEEDCKRVEAATLAKLNRSQENWRINLSKRFQSTSVFLLTLSIIVLLLWDAFGESLDQPPPPFVTVLSNVFHKIPYGFVILPALLLLAWLLWSNKPVLSKAGTQLRREQLHQLKEYSHLRQDLYSKYLRESAHEFDLKSKSD